jgi:Fe-S cluster biosynthesis and repair protein YggX
MPEEQGVWGDSWNDRLNNFAKVALHWNQLGASNNDIYCDLLKKKVGIDSVYAYRHNQQSFQQVVIAEAKSLKIMDYVNRSRVQKWIDEFIVKIEHVPASDDFSRVYNPDVTAQYQLGLLALWVRDQKTFSQSDMANVLSQVRIPRRKTPINLGFVTNNQIINLCSIHQTIQMVVGAGEYDSVEYYIPSYGNSPSSDGRALPIETVMSRIIFCRTTRKQVTKTAGGELHNTVLGYFAFYLGDVRSYADLRFVGLALKHFQMFHASEISIYTLSDAIDIRNYTELFKQEFRSEGVEFSFRQLDTTANLPGWLNSDD